MAIVVGLCLTTQAQDPSPTAALVEAKARKLIEVKKLISAEASAWEEQKQLFSDLIALREKEIAGIDEFTANAETRIADVKKKRAALDEEETSRKQWRSEFEKKVVDLENSLKPHLLRFPPPLREKIQESILRLEEGDPETPLQNRFRDVASILNATAEFQNTITVSSDIREVGEKSVEVDILYLGLTQAWFVDRSGDLAGIGTPTDNGWQWTEDTALASRIRQAIQIQSKESAPGFVSLPFQSGEAQGK